MELNGELKFAPEKNRVAFQFDGRDGSDLTCRQPAFCQPTTSPGENIKVWVYVMTQCLRVYHFKTFGLIVQSLLQQPDPWLIGWLHKGSTWYNLLP